MNLTATLPRRLALLCGIGLLAAACTAPGPNSDTAAAIQVHNAGRTLSFARPPQHIVSLYPGMTDTLIRLGVADRVIAQAGTDYAPYAPDVATAASAIRVLSGSETTGEALLATHPDLVVADQEYHFDGTRLPGRDELASVGIAVYINQALWEPHKLDATISGSLDDLTDLGTVLGVTDTARALRDRLDARLRAATAKAAALPRYSVLEVTLYADQVYSHAGGLYGDILDAAHLRNLVTRQEMDPGDYSAQLAVEALLPRQPEVVVYSYRSNEERAGIEARLRTLFAATPAGRAHRFIGLPETATAGGESSVAGLEQLVEALATQ
ncbi:ABC transporter substrate-binding protein [Nocardia sp. NBC_00511]|uniref:ABC transporter substrate-binding protein n=1 Tax=Nocardia sp. NBC_00511 TaxID=2903591 RepID=UPI0030E2AFBD